MSTNIIKIFFISLFSLSFAGFVNDETGWEYQQSTFQAFYMLEAAQIDGEDITESDVLGSFIERNGETLCLGWVYGDSEGYTTIPVMGDDGSEYSSGYIGNGEIIHSSGYVKIEKLKTNNNLMKKLQKIKSPREIFN